ncbi:AraC family transcriptional regulator [bacterium]|nr:MAG: AraC family transcriptional regulator [bacterium]
MKRSVSIASQNKYNESTMIYRSDENVSSDIKRIWQAIPTANGKYDNIANEHWSLFFVKEGSKQRVIIYGPASRPFSFAYQSGGSYWGVVFNAHVFLRNTSKKSLLNLSEDLTVIDDTMFEIDEVPISIPTYDSAVHFVEELKVKKIISAHPVVAHALNGKTILSKRSTQRYVANVTGMSRRTIERTRQAQKAFALLQQGESIASAALLAGYVDQAHMTNSFKLLIGMSPAQILTAASE